MADIAPALKENIELTLAESLATNSRLAELKDKLNSGKANYKDAHEYSVLMGNILTDALGQNVTAEVLPDGKLYYNIAERVVAPLLRQNYDTASEYAVGVQSIANEASGLGIKAIKPGINEDRVKGIIDRVSSEAFEDVAWILGEPVVTLTESAVDETLKQNCKWQSKAGVKPTIHRIAQYKCCKWCDSLEGIYTYPDDVPDDVYRRHENCRCTTEYIGNGIIQNVWSKAVTGARYSPANAQTNTPPQLQNQPQNLQDLRANTTKIAGTMNSNSYDEYIKLIETGNEGVKALYSNHGDELVAVRKVKDGGVFKPLSKIIEYDFANSNQPSKFSVISHEYGHFFDTLDDITQKLNFGEIDAIHNKLGALARPFHKVASSSDEYLEALRKDLAYLKASKTNADYLSLDRGTDAIYSIGVQDGIDGLMGFRVRWGHGDKYYNRRYNGLKSYISDPKKDLREVYKDLGYDVSNASKAKAICRNYETASELWANQISALTVNEPEELRLMEEYFSNTFTEIKRILSL